VGIGKRRDGASRGHCLNENFLPLAVKLGGENSDARRIAAGFGERSHESLPNHVVGQWEDRNLSRRPLRGANGRISARQDDIDLSIDQLGRVFFKLLDAQPVTARIDREVLALDEAKPPELVKERDMIWCIAWAGEHATKSINPSRFLRACRKRPRRRAAESQDELAPFHSITSSAKASRRGGTSRASVFAVFKLITSSKEVGCMTGKS